MGLGVWVDVLGLFTGSTGFFFSYFFTYYFLAYSFLVTKGVLILSPVCVVLGLGLLSLGGMSSFFFCGDTILSFGMICPAPLNTFGTTILSAKLKSGTILFLF